MISGEVNIWKPLARGPEVVIMGLNGMEVVLGLFWSLEVGASGGGVIVGSRVACQGSHLGCRQSSVRVAARRHLWELGQPSAFMEVQCAQAHRQLAECCEGSGREV